MSTSVTQQYLCNQCGHTVTPTPSNTPTLIYPNCTSTNLELLQNPNPTNNSADSDQLVSGAGDSAAVGVDDDFWLVDKPLSDFIRALTEYVMHGNDPDNLSGVEDDFSDGPEFDELFQQLNGIPPAAQVVIEALSSLTITEEMVGSGVSLCAICKESFCVGDVVKELPCKHVYHCDCVLPWLGLRNSCPLCRFELPTNDVEYENRTRGASSGGRSNGRDGNRRDGNGNAGGSTQNVD